MFKVIHIVCLIKANLTNQYVACRAEANASALAAAAACEAGLIYLFYPSESEQVLLKVRELPSRDLPLILMGT